MLDWIAITDALREVGYKGEFTYEADGFIKRFLPETLPMALTFMAQIARHWANRCE